jgi:F-type H+-transporting ATPase subunit epsilon
VFPGHAPFLTTLKIGQIKIRIGDTESFLATTGGIADVQSDTIAVLAETAEASKDIDVIRAEAARERAEKRLQEGRHKWNVDRAQTALLRALNRLRISSLK